MKEGNARQWIMNDVKKIMMKINENKEMNTNKRKRNMQIMES